MYNLLYPLLRLSFGMLLLALPPEAFNRLCLILPGRLIVQGLRHYGARIGKRVTFTAPAIFHNFDDHSAKPFANLRVGDDCYFGRGLFIDLKDMVYIEEQVTLAMNVTLVTHIDVGKSPLRCSLPNSSAPIRLRRGAYLGAGVTVLQGVQIGECAALGAGALATKSLTGQRLYVGVPAREVRCLEPEACLMHPANQSVAPL